MKLTWTYFSLVAGALLFLPKAAIGQNVSHVVRNHGGKQPQSFITNIHVVCFCSLPNASCALPNYQMRLIAS
jgi:hypothetical protein